MKSIISTCQGETFRAEALSPWSGTILLVTHGGWYLETERGDILLLHDVRFGEIPIGAALPDIGELPYDKRFEHQPLRFENGTLRQAVRHKAARRDYLRCSDLIPGHTQFLASTDYILKHHCLDITIIQRRIVVIVVSARKRHTISISKSLTIWR